MHRSITLVSFLLLALAGCGPSPEIITIDWHSGLPPVFQSERWRISSDGRLRFERERTSVYRGEASQNTHAELPISARQFRELSAILEPGRLAAERRGRMPCTAPDLPGFSVKYEHANAGWHWSSEVGCEQQSATATMRAAINAKLLLERWMGRPPVSGSVRFPPLAEH